jgi:hypothetical protein
MVEQAQAVFTVKAGRQEQVQLVLALVLVAEAAVPRLLIWWLFSDVARNVCFVKVQLWVAVAELTGQSDQEAQVFLVLVDTVAQLGMEEVVKAVLQAMAHLVV